MRPSGFFVKLKRRNVYRIAIGSALICWLAAQGAATAAPTQVPVPIEKEPRHRLKFENKFVRVFDVLIPPGDTTLFHTHVHDGLSVRITDAQIRDEALEGASEDSTVKRGAVTFSYRPKPMTHRVSNIGKTPFRNVFIEILQSTGVSIGAPSPAAGPGYTMVLENERVRVCRLVLAPGQSTDARPPALRGVRVAVSEGKILIKAKGEEDKTVKLQQGDSQWHEEGMRYFLKNVGSMAFEAVDIELK
jgi:quercetin dioxygenase-like cupin family protein